MLGECGKKGKFGARSWVIDLFIGTFIFLFNVGAGLFGSLLGLGGGVLIIPFLTLALGVPIHQAVATSIIAVIVNSIVGSTVYLKSEITNVRLGIFLETGTAIGAIAGALIATSLDRNILSIAFGILVFYGSWHMIRGRIDPRSEGEPNGRAPLTRKGLKNDRSSNLEVSYGAKRLGEGFGLCVIAGHVSGMLGVGGGIVQVPVMHKVMKIPVKVATATSNFMMGVTGAASAYIFYSKGWLDPLLAVPVLLGIYFGAQMGPRIAGRVRTIVIKRVFAIVLLYVAIRMILIGLGVQLPF